MSLPGGVLAKAIRGVNDWPEDAVELALAAINQRRGERNLKPIKLDKGLCESAEEHVRGYGDGSQQPHQGFPDRVRRRGWKQENCGIRNFGFGNVSEGVGAGASSPSDVILLDSSPDPNEGHRRDFEDPAFTHCGIAFAYNRGTDSWCGGMVYVVEWGARCSVEPESNINDTILIG